MVVISRGREWGEGKWGESIRLSSQLGRFGGSDPH